ncbi:MAG: cadherin domain-containing protein [Thermoanaerobaculia bacterium]
MNRFVTRLSIALVILAVATPLFAQSVPLERWIVPVVGSTAGANGAQFRTSMQLHNPGDVAAAGSIVYHPAGIEGNSSDPRLRYALAPYQTVSFDDIVASLGQSGLGSLDIVADAGTLLPTVTARAFNLLPNLGTLGSSVPVLHPDDALGRGDVVGLISPANMQRYRLNIGIRTLEGPVTLKITTFGADGNRRGEPLDRTYPAEYFEQTGANIFLGSPLLPNESLTFEILSGRAFIYGSTTDNRTNDPNIQIDRLFGRSISANDQSVTTPEDTPVTITLTGELQGSITPIFTITRAPLHGVLGAIVADGDTADVVYTPDPNYNGPDDFEFEISDGHNRSARGTVTINVTPVNDPPVAIAVVVTTDEDQSVVITLTGSDPDGDALTFAVASVPASGTLDSIVPVDGTTATIAYTPNPDYNGNDSFTFTVNDGTESSNAATVTIDVLPVNDAPLSTGDLFAGVEDTLLTIAPAGVLANDTDGDGDTLTAVLVTPPATGTLTLNADGSFSYTPAANANGTVSFTYHATDGTDSSPDVLVTIDVTPVNDAPSFVKGADVTLLEDAGAQSLAGWATALSAGPADESAQTLAFAVTNNSNPTLFSAPPAIAADGTLTFTSAPNANGTATITVQLADNGGTANGGVDTSAPQTFVITVTAVNDAPSFTKGGDATVLEDSGAQTLDPWATALSAGPADENTQTLAFSVTGNTNPALFAAGPAISATGALTFTPAVDASGSATITLTLADNGGTANGGADTSAAQTFVINVTEVNDAPSFTKGADATVLEDAGAQTFNPWATAISAGPAAEAGQTVAFNVVSNTNPALFSAQPSISPAGVLTFTPAPDAYGTATITINAQDNGGTANGGVDTSATQSFVVNVTPVNDAPSATITPAHNVDEDSGPHTVPAFVSAISPGPANESAQTVAFAVTGNTNLGLFAAGPAIDPSGTLSYTLAPDQFGTATLTIALTDNGGTSNGGVDTATLTFTINVAAVNDAPTSSGGGTYAVNENTANGGPTSARFFGNDVDPGQTLSVVVTAGNTGGAFALAGGCGADCYDIVVANSAILDFETNPTFVLTVTGTDDGVPALSTTQIFTITLNDLNEAPTVNPATFNVDENSANGTLVGTATGTDPDAGQMLSWVITGGTGMGVFAINPATGDITVVNSAALDFESAASFVLDVQVSDNGVPMQFGTGSFTIAVNNVNEAPVVTLNTLSILENSANGTFVGPVAASDPDAGQTLTYAITAGNTAGAFAIDAAGVITVANTAVLDFETSPTFVLTVTATDNGAPALFGSATITVNLIDQNEPPVANNATLAVDENSAVGTAVGTVTATDPESAALNFAISAGNTGGAFAINPTTGAITVANPVALDFETNPTFTLTINVDDGFWTVQPTITINLNDLNEAPTITSGATANVAENTTAVMTVTATDPEAASITFSISGGADQALFSINPTTGALTFNAAPDFEAPADAGGNNIYDVDVTATDGVNPVVQSIAVTVTNVNEAPVITSAAATAVPENTTGVLTVTTTDAEGDAVTYSITGGTDAALFSINATTGALTFNAAPDFEVPGDADTNNQYLVEVTATDGTTPVAQTITVAVTDVNEAPVITSPATIGVPENTTPVLTVTATDPEGNTITYSISGGADAALFSINGTTGSLAFLAAPDFEAPLDAGNDNVYNVQVQASDLTNNVTQDIAVTVVGTNEAPVITSPATASVPENTTAVLTVTTTEPEGQLVSYSITGGADAALFSIGGVTGVLAFNVPPDFEAPTDADANNAYLVEVTATDGTNPVAQTITVTVTDVNEAPAFTSSATPSVPENTTAVITVTATDPEGNPVTYSISGGADMALFSINASTGALTFNAAPDFEAPADADTNNAYLVQVTATDGSNPVVQSLTVTVTNANEAPAITSAATASVPENTTAVVTVTTTDPEGDSITFTISGGADQALFSINPVTGALTFDVAPNFEAPADADANNAYLVQVTATDGTNPVSQNLTVTVTDVNEAPSFTSLATPSVAENTTAVVTVTAVDPEGVAPAYSITGGADMALFTINGVTGALSFVAAPDFEAPVDTDTDNVYLVVVTASDGTNNPTQAITVTVTDANDPPTFTSTPTPSVPENTTGVITVTANDPEANTITYSITGGVDAALFTINGSSGALSFLSAPNFEAPADSGANNVYDVIVTASDGTNAPTQAIAVTVTNVNEAPVITSPGTASVPENSTAILTVTAIDPDAGASITYSITGGADMALFTINGATGALSFISGPDFEAPGDAGANNVYDLVVTASDGTNAPTQAIAVTVTNVNEGPSFTSPNAVSYAENGVGAVITVTTSDPESDTVTYAFTGGTDTGDLSINPTTGVVTFNASPNYEAPADSDTNNTYVVEITATDGTTPITQTLTVTVTNVNEVPSITGGTGAMSVNENTVGTITTVTATDPDGTTPTFAIVGGADAAEFNINATTGALSFAANPNFEAPADADTNNIYLVTVRATDGSLFDDEPITVTVINVNEAPTAVVDAYTALGNTTLHIAGTVVVPGTTVAKTGDVNASPRTTGTIFNDTDPDTIPAFNTLTITLVGAVPVPGTTATTNGSVTLHADGSFIYTPNPGYTGADSFTYTINDGASNVVGTVNLTVVGPVVWYVKNNAPTAGNGTSAAPYQLLSAAITASAAGHTIYVMEGDGTATNYGGSNAMKASQRLWGQGIDLDVTAANGVALPDLILATNRPLIGPGAALGTVTIGNGITGVEVRGLRIDGGTLNAVDLTTSGANSAGLIFSDNIVTAAALEGIDVNAGGSGTVTLGINDNTFTSNGTAIDIARTAGSVVVQTLDDNLVSGNTGGSGIIISGPAILDASSTAGLQTVLGGTTMIGALGNGVGTSGIVLTNVEGDLHFTNLSIYNDNGTGLGATGTGTGLQVRVNSGGANAGVIESTGGPAIDANATTLDLRLTGLKSTNSTSTGISLVNVPGTVSAPTGSSITNAATTDFVINGSAANVTYAGTIYDNTGPLINVTNTTGGTKLFSGAIDDLDGAADPIGGGAANNGGGISLTNNGAATIRFTGGIELSTGATAAFAATGGGTVEVCDENACNVAATGALINRIVTTTGTALNVANTTIGANGLEFRSIAANGATNGIILNTTGNGALKVKGDGTLARNDSGGVIQNTSGDAIRLTNAYNVTLQSMTLRGNGANPVTAADAAGTSGNHSIEISGGSNVVLSGVYIDASKGSGLVALNLGGTNQLNNNTRFENTLTGAGHSVYVNNTNTNMTLFELNNVQMVDNAANHTNFFFANTGTSNMALTVQNNCLFEDLRTQALTVAAGGTAATTGTLTSTITGNTFQNAKGTGENNIGILVNNGATHTSTVSNNTLQNIAKDGTIANTSIIRTQNSGGIMDATVTGNTIQNIAYGAGAGGRHVIGHVFEPVAYSAGYSSILTFTSNTINNITYPFLGNNREAFFVDYRPAAAGGKVTIQGNNVNMPTAGAQQAIELRFRQTNSNTVRALVRGNTINFNTVNAFLDVDAEDGANVQLTVDGVNTFTNSNGTPGTTIAVATEDPAAAGGPSSMCVNITGNTLQGGTGTISLDETAGTMTVTQSNASQVASANGIPNLNVTTTGTPQFNAAPCTLP